MKRVIKAIVVVSTLFLAATSHAIYIAGIDFVSGENPDGSETNPRGPWTYGYRSPLESTTLTPVASHIDSSSDFNGFHDEIEGYIDVVSILANTGTGQVVLDSGFGDYAPLNPNQMAMHPGAGNQFSIVRWTAPVANTFNILASWTDLDPNGGNGGSGHVVINGTNFISMERFWDNGGSGASFGTFSLNAGDTVDFALGSRGDYTFDTTGFDATITAIPEPASIWLLGSGLMALLGMVTKKRGVIQALPDNPLHRSGTSYGSR